MRAEAVDLRPEDRARDDADEGVRREDEARDREPDAADVVQVDEEERHDDAVSERVQEPADLEGRHRAGKGGKYVRTTSRTVRH